MSIATDTMRDNITVSQKALKNNAEKALEKAKVLHEKRGKKVKLLKQGESNIFNNLKKKK